MPRRNTKDGFTIIEIMIVLAIAGLILLIVFIAVPALQRTTRNTERKRDAGILATLREQYDLDNATTTQSGADQCPQSGSFADFCAYVTSGFSYYPVDEVTIVNNGYTTPTCIPDETTSCPTYAPLETVPLVTPDDLITESYLVCNNSLTGATVAGANPEDFVVLYALETSSGEDTECLQGSLIQSG